VGELVAGILQERINHGELAVPEVAIVPRPRSASKLSACCTKAGEDPLLDFGVLGGVHDTVADIDQGLQVVLDCFRSDEPPYAAQSPGQADSPDLRGRPGTFDTQEADQRPDAGVVFQLGQQRG